MISRDPGQNSKKRYGSKSNDPNDISSISDMELRKENLKRFNMSNPFSWRKKKSPKLFNWKERRRIKRKIQKTRKRKGGNMTVPSQWNGSHRGTHYAPTSSLPHGFVVSWLIRAAIYAKHASQDQSYLLIHRPLSFSPMTIALFFFLIFSDLSCRFDKAMTPLHV